LKEIVTPQDSTLPDPKIISKKLQEDKPSIQQNFNTEGMDSISARIARLQNP